MTWDEPEESGTDAGELVTGRGRNGARAAFAKATAPRASEGRQAGCRGPRRFKDEKAGELRVPKQVLGGRASRQFPEVADEMRLVRIAAISRRLGTAPRRLHFVQHTQRPLKSRDPGEALRRDADVVQKPALEVPSRHGRMSRHTRPSQYCRGRT